MSKSKHLISDSAIGPDKVTAPDKAQEGSAGAVEQTKSAPVVSRPGSGRKAPGSKEVIPFRWKLVGKSGGVVLTLFKAIQREEVEDQLRRVHEDGYYTDLRILEIDEKVQVAAGPPPAKPDVKSGKRSETKTTTKPAEPRAPARAGLQTTATSRKLKPAARRARPARTKTAKPKAQPPPKRQRGAGHPKKKKKSAGAKSTRKRAARKGKKS